VAVALPGVEQRVAEGAPRPPARAARGPHLEVVPAEAPVQRVQPVAGGHELGAVPQLGGGERSDGQAPRRRIADDHGGVVVLLVVAHGEDHAASRGEKRTVAGVVDGDLKAEDRWAREAFGAQVQVGVAVEPVHVELVDATALGPVVQHDAEMPLRRAPWAWTPGSAVAVLIRGLRAAPLRHGFALACSARTLRVKNSCNHGRARLSPQEESSQNIGLSP
jgi:hypothetical protein